MNLITVSDDKTFSLSNRLLTYAFRVTPEGLLEHLYFGPALSEPPSSMTRMLRHCTVMFEDQDDLTLNELPQEYPTAGRGDFSAPAFHAVGSANSVFSLQYKSHRVETGKPLLAGLPSARGEGAETLILTLVDSIQDLEIDLHYSIWENYGVIARHTIVRNMGTAEVSLRQVASSALDLPPSDYEILHFHGSWAREFNAERLPVPKGRFSIESNRGASSNAHPPYLSLLEMDATETAGRCYGVTLAYSGNHHLSVETGEFDRVRLLAGLNPFDFEWSLAAGESFTAPEALLAVSDEGLGGLSHIWHDFIRDRVSPDRFRNLPRPTYLNSWEATYFDIDENKVLDLADRAAEISVDMLVVDDGWFKGRVDDRRALGDWIADPDRFGKGIPDLARSVRDRGLKFGLWFEPEMVSTDSDLYRCHPDWVIGVERRPASLGRHQLTLDLSNPDIVDYLYAQLDAILSCGLVDYVKWDMNRNMTEVESGAKAHRYMLGLYNLLERITTTYPDILFENCASGGNRFDLGMLSYMTQNWTSDMCDPIGRLAIINGASHLFPMDVMAAYVGPSPNHQNGRRTSLKARFAAGAICAAQGLSLNLTDLDKHKDQLTNLMGQSKKTASTRLGARFYRLRHTQNETIWQQISRTGETVQLIAFHCLNAPNLPQRRIRLRGLETKALYQMENSDPVRGDLLMHHGLNLPMPTEDFAAELLILQKVS